MEEQQHLSNRILEVWFALWLLQYWALNIIHWFTTWESSCGLNYHSTSQESTFLERFLMKYLPTFEWVFFVCLFVCQVVNVVFVLRLIAAQVVPGKIVFTSSNMYLQCIVLLHKQPFSIEKQFLSWHIIPCGSLFPFPYLTVLEWYHFKK